MTKPITKVTAVDLAVHAAILTYEDPDWGLKASASDVVVAVADWLEAAGFMVHTDLVEVAACVYDAIGSTGALLDLCMAGVTATLLMVADPSNLSCFAFEGTIRTLDSWQP